MSVLTKIAGINVPIKKNMVKNYKPFAEYVNSLTPSNSPMKTDHIKSIADWNKYLIKESGLADHNSEPFIRKQQGICANRTGAVSIKSTMYGKIKYQDDRIKPEKGIVYYETAEVKGNELFYDRADNYGLICAFVDKKVFLVFSGENKALKYMGPGMIIDIFPNSTGKAAIFKIRVFVVKN